MHYVLLVFTPLFLFTIYSQPLQARAKPPKKHDPLLAIVLMAKNEESVMVRTLKPFVEAQKVNPDGTVTKLIDSYLILDTQSGDKTAQVTKNYFKEQKVKRGYVVTEPFKAVSDAPTIDYAATRNRSLELAEQKFPHAAFFLIVDAEWYFHGVEELIAFCQKHANLSLDDPAYASSYLITVRHTGGGHYYPSPRLFRASCKLRYKDDIHEQPVEPTNKKLPKTIYFEQSPERYGDKKSQERWERTDKERLLKRYKDNPQDKRSLFLLARTHFGLACTTYKLEDLELAYKYYKERLKLVIEDISEHDKKRTEAELFELYGITQKKTFPKYKNCTEEDFMAMYELAQTTERRAKRQRSFSWIEALSYYLQAYAMRPHRIEPLIRIAQYYLQVGMSNQALLCARKAFDVPFPDNELLWVEEDMYTFHRYDMLSQCAWFEKDYELGEKAVLKALEINSDNKHFQSHLELYKERKAEQKEQSQKKAAITS